MQNTGTLTDWSNRCLTLLGSRRRHNQAASSEAKRPPDNRYHGPAPQSVSARGSKTGASGGIDPLLTDMKREMSLLYAPETRACSRSTATTAAMGCPQVLSGNLGRGQALIDGIREIQDGTHSTGFT